MVKFLTAHLVWDILLCSLCLYLWVGMKKDTPTFSSAEKQQQYEATSDYVGLYWQLVLLPPVIFRCVLLLNKYRVQMPTTCYRFRVRTVMGYQFLINLILLIVEISFCEAPLLENPGFSFTIFQKTICVTLQLNLYTLAWFSLTKIFAFMDWMCTGCGRDTANTRKLGAVARAFDPFKFREHFECVICLMEFQPNEMVTVLPCDVRHYFHANCIQDWSRKEHSTCPLCKKEFTADQICEFNSRLSLILLSQVEENQPQPKYEQSQRHAPFEQI